MPFSFLQRGSLPEHAKQLTLQSYEPQLRLEGLAVGVDNVRSDVFLSPRFCQLTREHIYRLITKYGAVEDLAVEDQGPAAPWVAPTPAASARNDGPAEFKRALIDLTAGALNRAKADGNQLLDLLARLAVLKLQRAEMAAQFALVTERCRAKVRSYDGPRTGNSQRAHEVRERFSQLQINKRNVLRKVGQELFATWREAEKESLARLRRSLFGEENTAAYELLVNRLVFTEDGKDDFVSAEHYVMLGNYDRDADRFSSMLEIATAFMQSLFPKQSLGAPDDERRFDPLLSHPENAQELVAGGSPADDNKGKAQRAVLEAWVEALENAGVMEHVVAAYEVAPLLRDYVPPINPQQLKNALVSKTERKRVEALLQEHGKISPDALLAAVKRVEVCRGNERAKVAGRFLADFIRYHRDLRRMEAVSAAMESVNVVANERLRELSRINNTLYEFLLPEEQKPAEEKVVHHVILKADIRDSTTLTRTLFERGLNPASYFSLNFYDPVNKLLPKYAASKVFIEGDAVILALFEREGEAPLGVAKTCVLAKEMIEIVRAYNANSERQGLPTLELGIGISYQDSAPMYLMDGMNRIMISKALNESDRLSSCTKGARKYIEGKQSPFSVFSFQTVEDKDTAGMPDEFLVRYNVGGIHLSAAAFEKLRSEIALAEYNAKVPMPWGEAGAKLYKGLVQVAQGSFHPLILREGVIPHVDAIDRKVKSWTARRYYEVCVHPAVYAIFEKKTTTSMAAVR
jgi:hypothetical protein